MGACPRIIVAGGSTGRVGSSGAVGAGGDSWGSIWLLLDGGVGDVAGRVGSRVGLRPGSGMLAGLGWSRVIRFM